MPPNKELEKVKKKRIGILLTNIGTPDAPTPKAVRCYLKQFLSDPRVVQLPKLLWQPILRGIILPFRSPRSVNLYKKIWQKDGSPLLTTSEQQMQYLQEYLTHSQPNLDVKIALGMNYGTPSISNAIKILRDYKVDKIITLPLFPQYSTTTTASTHDAAEQALSTCAPKPELKFINHYYNNKYYIDALVDSIKTHWKKELNQKPNQKYLIFSFHGIPTSYINPNEPYDHHCHQTARLVAEQLNLKDDEWAIAFQSRIGKTKWLQPYCVNLLESLPQKGITAVDIICPGFSADCLETLEEIAITNRQKFLNAGGKTFQYIPALNTSKKHIHALASIINEQL